MSSGHLHINTDQLWISTVIKNVGFIFYFLHKISYAFSILCTHYIPSQYFYFFKQAIKIDLYCIMVIIVCIWKHDIAAIHGSL